MRDFHKFFLAAPVAGFIEHGESAVVAGAAAPLPLAARGGLYRAPVWQPAPSVAGVRGVETAVLLAVVGYFAAGLRGVTALL